MVATLLLTLMATSTRAGSTLVALCEDHLAPQIAPLVTSGEAARSNLVFLEGSPSSCYFKVSHDQLSAGR